MNDFDGVQQVRGNLSFHRGPALHSDSRREVLDGLLQPRKMVDPKYFYDERGSELFAQITALPEYYPSRAEASILRRHRDDIAAACGRGCVLIEPGSGSSAKVRLLLASLQPRAYVPLDISSAFLYRSCISLSEAYPWLRVHAICADFSGPWRVPDNLPAGRRVVFYPGSTIGNLSAEDACAFLRRARHWVGPDGAVLIGVDLHKSSEILTAAYNDRLGVTAAFNRNLLQHLNRILDADFAAHTFSHHAFYDARQFRIEMHLVSELAQTIACAGHRIRFERGETIHTENSYKYTLASFGQLAQRAGLELCHSWFDDDKLFSVHYLEVS